MRQADEGAHPAAPDMEAMLFQVKRSAPFMLRARHGHQAPRTDRMTRYRPPKRNVSWTAVMVAVATTTMILGGCAWALQAWG